MSDIFKCMLATDADLGKLRFPLLASAKLDGVRAVVRNGVVYSRSNKPIPNAYVQKLFSRFEHFDGELIVGDPTSKTCYRDTISGVMSFEGKPEVRFDHVFTRAAGVRCFVTMHMHVPACWTLRKAADLRNQVELILLTAMPQLHASIELMPRDIEPHQVLMADAKAQSQSCDASSCGTCETATRPVCGHVAEGKTAGKCSA